MHMTVYSMHSILIYLTKTAENKLNKFVLENLTQLVLLDCIVQISRMIISISESAFISQYFRHKNFTVKTKSDKIGVCPLCDRRRFYLLKIWTSLCIGNVLYDTQHKGSNIQLRH